MCYKLLYLCRGNNPPAFMVQNTLHNKVLYNLILFERWIRTNKLSPQGFAVLFELNNKAGLILTDFITLRIYYDHPTCQRNINKLLKRGLVCRIGFQYSLTGKGEILLNQFFLFCRDNLK